ncbi:MAG: 1-deoxy-D-xylulose-5-phosphate reductoisomerase [Bacillota bacterium]
MQKGLAILGSTGSIGTQTLEVVESYPERFRVWSLAGGENIDLLEEQIRKFQPVLVAVGNTSKASELQQRLSGLPVEVMAGKEGLLAAVSLHEVHTVVAATSGVVGIKPTLQAIRQGKTIALANKETLVVAGEQVMKAAMASGVAILPVDSEHSAIFQCLAGRTQGVESIILTASGGPFQERTLPELKTVTASMALRHPKWHMGKKITVDSATLMNKGLEVIEARWLFDLKPEQIKVVIHPESIVHSLVAYQDGALLAQLGLPDMRIPIQYALTWPERWLSMQPRLDLTQESQLNFLTPDIQRFPCLKLAYEALRCGGTMPAVLNAANEVLVESFLAGSVGFMDIPLFIEKAMSWHRVNACSSLEETLEVDRETRRYVKSLVGGAH